MIRLLIVEPQSLSGSMMASALQSRPDLEVVGTVSDVAAALPLAPQCDIVLLSAELPEAGALAVARALRNGPPAVLVTGLVDSPALIVSFLEAGATGYILSDSTSEQLVETIRAVHAGESELPPAIVTMLVERMRELLTLSKRLDREPAQFAESTGSLTEREQAVLALLAEGLSNQAIATQLVIELGTVKNHVHSILKKLNVSSRVEAARYYLLNAARPANSPPDPKSETI